MIHTAGLVRELAWHENQRQRSRACKFLEKMEKSIVIQECYGVFSDNLNSIAPGSRKQEQRDTRSKARQQD